MKAFVIVCTCPERHQQTKTSCPFEMVMVMLISHNMTDIVHDVLDIQPVFEHKDVKP